MDIQKLDQTYIAGTYARFPVTIVKAVSYTHLTLPTKA